MNDARRLLIFDLDGLLVDTERLFYKAFKSVAKQFGLAPRFEEYVREVVSAGREITELFPLAPHAASQLRQQVHERYGALLKDATLRPGAAACLQRLAHYECVLVTGSRKEHADILLAKFQLAEFFRTIITRDDGFPHKPDPTVFEHLMQRYGRSPWECLVIEDSRRGVTAALALGMPCIYIPTEYTRSDELSPRVRQLPHLHALSVQVVEEVISQWEPKADHTLVNLYRDSIARLRDTFAVYQDVYGLPEVEHADAGVLPAAFDYAKKRSFFVILIMTTRDGRVYLHRSFDTGHLTMVPPGGALHLEEDETLLPAIHRIAQRILKNARLADVAPVVYLRNLFVSSDGETPVEHIGLGVRALLLNSADELEAYGSDASLKGAFVDDFPSSEIPQPPARATYEHFRQWLKHKDYSTYLNEIDTQHDVQWRYKLHQAVVNPVFVTISRFVGRMSIPAAKAKIMDVVGSVPSCLDVACGDDQGVFSLLRRIPRVVANDISVDQVAALEATYNRRRLDYPKAHSILFTNHDCLDLPFRPDAFAVSLCRNLLHHMRTAKDLELLLANMRRVARRIVIVEVEDPSRGAWWERLRHRYYLDWLKDEGRHFYNRSDFEKVLQSHFAKDRLRFEYLPTLRGTYMMAEITKAS